jgi:RimJ/RimL family protein N-acetyltransferase
MNIDRIQEHSITLRGNRTALRPMTETDWGLLVKWNNDLEVLWFSEGGNVESRPLDDVQGMYREVSRTGLCFIIEIGGLPIGECWLQEMNLDRVLSRYPGKDCRRIDLMIGEKCLWGQGYGTETIKILTKFGFEQANADFIFGCGITDYNPRSRKAFEKAGYTVDRWIENSPGSKARCECDMVLSQDDYLRSRYAEQGYAADTVKQHW